MDFNRLLNQEQNRPDPDAHGISGHVKPVPLIQTNSAWGGFLNKECFDGVSEVSQIFKRVIMKGPIKTAWALEEWTAGYTEKRVNMMVAISIGWAGSHGHGDPSMLYASMAYQGLASHVPRSHIPESEAATEKALKRVAAGIWTNKARAVTQMTTALDDAYTAWVAVDAPGRGLDSGHKPQGGGETNATMEEVGFPASIPLETEKIPILTAIALIRLVANNLRNRRDLLTTLYVHFIIAYAKRGEITKTKGLNIVREVNLLMDRTIGFESDTVTKIWTMAGPFLTEITAGPILSGIESLVGTEPETQRLRLTVQQATKSGLTSLVIVTNAMNLFPTFYWGKIAQMFPAEMTAVDSALKAVNNNPYYGFRSDLGDAKSTKYRNVTFIAKSLLIRIAGQSSLSGYRGFLSAPAYAQRVENLITQFITLFGATYDGDTPEGALKAAADVIARAKATNTLHEG